MKNTHAVSKSLKDFAGSISGRRGNDIVAILYSPQPFTQGEVFIICDDEVESAAELLTWANAFYNKPYRLYCLREKELWELAEAHWFIPSGNTYFPNPAYTLRTLGVVLYGTDVRDQIPLPKKPEHFLQAQIEGSRFYVRNHQILSRLTKRDYIGLLEHLTKQFHFLMASAIVTKVPDGFMEKDIEDKFVGLYSGTNALSVWKEFTELLSSSPPNRESAFEAVWFFERFMAELSEDGS